MWSAVAPDDVKSAAPSARSKHSATVVGDHVFLLGGRNGNLPTKDFWKYNLVTGKWHQLKPIGEKLPCLQEHTAVAYQDNIYVFGGEVSFSAGTETPLWVYDIKANCWKKVRTKKGVATPKGCRGHTALVYKGAMLIYGGYQDLKGSSGELWAFHFETESWHLLSSSSSKNNDQYPAPRHKHSAILHEDAIWIYGGMTDLQERSDLWKWDFKSRIWTNIKAKISPGPLHSHAACKMPSSMLIFGGERNGQTVNDLWKFNFTTESWEKITISGLKPQPRAETIAFTVSELLLNDPSQISLESRAIKIRQRTCNSADRGNRHSSYLPNNRIAPSEKTYVFQPSDNNYNDGSDIKSELKEQFSDVNRSSRSFLQEISKFSQLNISKISNKCSYTVLTGSNTSDSTESLLRQHASPQNQDKDFTLDLELSTPSRGTMVKSKSAHILKKKYQLDISPTIDDENKEHTKKKVDFDPTIKKITREPISVPNFSVLNLASPVLTPVEATKLVYLTDEENDCDSEERRKESKAPDPEKIIEVKTIEKDIIIFEKDNAYEENFEMDNLDTFDSFKLRRGESYSSHVGYADNPLYQEMIKSFKENEENVSSTSDYASIETVNRLSSASNYSVKTATPQEENLKNRQKDKEGPFGFCNPNYMGPEIKMLLNNETREKKVVAKLLTTKSLDCNDKNYDEDEVLELQDLNGVIDKNTKVLYRHSCRTNRPPKTLTLECNKPTQIIDKHRAQSASRIERNNKVIIQEKTDKYGVEPFVPLYVYIMGGKEQGQVTVFQRPISIWKLKLF